MITRHKISIRELNNNDRHDFINAILKSYHIYDSWVSPPKNCTEFEIMINKFNNNDNYCFVIYNTIEPNIILGIINLTQIIRGVFQNSFLSYYATNYGVSSGVMSKGLQLVLKHAFTTLNLHRIEANIQPENKKSITFVERNGFVKEGYSKNYLYINNKWRDHVRYAIINPNIEYKFDL